ncbi:MAG TPA: M36 family metallopeptidase, partial [Saprospiraceae bacterium]|nr:M36 family metallopeptidase [Saprospiraceae bacterium]
DNATDVTIPSVFITHSECNRIRIAAGKGLVASLVAPVQTGAIERDGSMDNGIISHEYGHGISNRLTGSRLDNREGGSMGEGWSDFFALVTTVQPGDTRNKSRGIGTYAIKENITGTGIRTYPYTTDMNVNPHTYDAIIQEAEAHGVGSVWCVMLWDMYWDFVDAYGLDLDPIHGTGGNNMAIQLVMDGLKYQPGEPSFTDARDAILKADSINNGGVNNCLIWKAFARRGLGVNAQANNPDSWSDGKEGFEVPKSCLDEVKFTKTMTPEIKAGDNIEVTIRVINYKDFVLTNVAVEDQIPAGTSYIPGSANITPVIGNSLVWTLPDMAPDEEVIITYALATSTHKNSVRLMFDDMENVPEDRWDVTFDQGGNLDNFWYPSDVLVHSGISAWGVGDPADASQHYLTNYDAFTVSGDYPVYRFYHYYNTESGADGGFLELTTDDGESWHSLQSVMFRNAYPRKIQYATFVIPNLYAFSGLSNTELTMTPVYIDLSEWAGQDVKMRYRFGSDDNTAGVGWYIDDVELMDAVIYNAEACLTNDELDPTCVVAPERGTIVDTEVILATEDDNSAYPFTLLPNPAGDYVQVLMSAEYSEKAQVNIYSMTGQLVSNSSWNIAQGSNQKTFDISRFAPGMYVLQVKSGKGMRSERFVKD